MAKTKKKAIVTRFDRFTQDSGTMAQFMSMCQQDCRICPIRVFCQDAEYETCEETWKVWLDAELTEADKW